MGYLLPLSDVHLSDESEIVWYGGDRDAWLRGEPRIMPRELLEPRWKEADLLNGQGQQELFQRAGRQHLHVNLCLPVTLNGEVVAHLNLESLTDDHAFTEQSIQDAQVFGQQIGALLQLQERWRELDTLAKLHTELSGESQEVEAHLVDAALELLRASYASLLRYDAQQDVLTISVVRGDQSLRQSILLPRGQGLSWQALSRRQVIRVADIQAERLAHHPAFGGLEPSAFMAVPLFSRTDQPLGVLTVTRPVARPFQPAEESLTVMLASLGARVLERRVHLEELQSTLEASLSTLGLALEARDFETQGHTRRVTDLAERLGQALALPPERLTALRHGAALHDIGKLSIPDEILLKPGPLTAQERETVNMHASLGADLAARIPYLHPEAHGLVRHHHERWDGAGYPDLLAGEDIPLLARMFALCDVYDALISTRPYKAALPEPQATEIIREGRGTQFDPHLTDVFLDVVLAGASARPLPVTASDSADGLGSPAAATT